MFAVFAAIALAQDIPSLRHSDIADGRPPGIEEGFVGSYVTAAGFTLDVGDHLTLGTPLGSSSSITLAGGGGGAAGVGGAVARGAAVQNAFYQTVYNGTQQATMAKAVLLGLSGNVDPSLFMAPRSLAGSEIEVVQMKLAGSKKRPFIWVECKFVNEAERRNASGLITPDHASGRRPPMATSPIV